MSAKGRANPKPSTAGTTEARKKLAAADFYSALQRSLDAVQRQLSSANNTFADFVVKEFKIDAAVQMHLNELGVLQLVLADDTMTPHSVSRVSLTLAAVAKMPEESPPNNMVTADVTALADLSWLPPQLATHLAKNEVKTVSEFLGLVSDARFSTQIASLLKVRRADIGRWANQMRLLELPGMTVQFVEILGQLRIHAIADLARLTAKAIVALQRKAAKTLTKEMLVKWRDAAKRALF
jgi:Domain of unknown function (DUF4332)